MSSNNSCSSDSFTSAMRTYLMFVQKFSLLIRISTRFTISCCFNTFRFLLVFKVFSFINDLFLNGLSEILLWLEYFTSFAMSSSSISGKVWPLSGCLLFLLVLFFPRDLQSPFSQSLQIIIVLQIPLLCQWWLTWCLFRNFFWICSFYTFHNLLLRQCL